MSLVTVGYGDVVVKNVDEDRLIDSLLILLGLLTLGVWVAYGQQTRRRRARSGGMEDQHCEQIMLCYYAGTVVAGFRCVSGADRVCEKKTVFFFRIFSIFFFLVSNFGS